MSATIVTIAHKFSQLLCEFEVGAYSGVDCAELAIELAATEKACGAARLLAAARAADCGAHRELGFSDAAAWVANQAGSTRGEARRDLEMARGLESYLSTKSAMLSGEISIDQAAEIARSEADCPGAEADLLAEARAGDLSSLRDKIRERVQANTPVDELHDRQRRARLFRHWTDRLGMSCAQMALPPEIGVPIMSRIEVEAKRLHRQAKRDDKEEPFSAHAADAVAALLAGGGDPKPRPAQTEVILVCDIYAWRRGHAEPGEPCHIIGGGPIPVDLAKELSKDAFLKVALHDGVNVHTVSHQGRHIPAELKTALDLGPVPAFSGRCCTDCGNRFGLEYDHVDPIANQGPTSYDNLQARCWRCHHAKTERDRAAGLLGPSPPARPPP